MRSLITGQRRITKACRQPSCINFETLPNYTAGVKPLALCATQLPYNTR